MQTNGFNPGYYPSYQPQIPTFLPNQASQVPARPTIFGRPVQDASQIMPNEVPMDGTIAIFPLQDYSKIYAKQWTKNGTIETMCYIPETPVEPESVPNPYSELTEHIDAKFDEVLAAMKPKTVYRKKAGENDA